MKRLIIFFLPILLFSSCGSNEEPFDDWTLPNRFIKENEISLDETESTLNSWLSQISEESLFLCHLYSRTKETNNGVNKELHFNADYISEYYYDEEDGEKCYLFNYVEGSVKDSNLSQEDEWLIDWPSPELGEGIYIALGYLDQMYYDDIHFYLIDGHMSFYREFKYLDTYSAVEAVTFDINGLSSYVERVIRYSETNISREVQLAEFESYIA